MTKQTKCYVWYKEIDQFPHVILTPDCSESDIVIYICNGIPCHYVYKQRCFPQLKMLTV